MRDDYDAIRDTGGDVVAIGTGSPEQARAFADDYRIPYTLLADDAGEAARVASIERVGPLRLLHPRSWPGARRAWRAGHRIGLSGRRVDQLGSSFVVGPGTTLHYAHRDRHTADHAPLDEMLAALRA